MQAQFQAAALYLFREWRWSGRQQNVSGWSRAAQVGRSPPAQRVCPTQPGDAPATRRRTPRTPPKCALFTDSFLRARAPKKEAVYFFGRANFRHVFSSFMYFISVFREKGVIFFRRATRVNFLHSHNYLINVKVANEWLIYTLPRRPVGARPLSGPRSAVKNMVRVCPIRITSPRWPRRPFIRTKVPCERETTIPKRSASTGGQVFKGGGSSAADGKQHTGRAVASEGGWSGTGGPWINEDDPSDIGQHSSTNFSLQPSVSRRLSLS